MIYEYTNAILSILQGIENLQEVFAYPVGEDERITKYPAAVFYHTNFENSFESVADNRVTHRFKIWVVIGCEKDTQQTVFTDALPKTVDAVVEAFATQWNGGTIEGHRARYLLTAGDTSLVVAEGGREAVCELTLDIRTLQDAA